VCDCDCCHYADRIPLVQRHAASPDAAAAKPKQEKPNKPAAKQKEEEQPQIQDADERLLTDVHGQATAAVDKIVCTTLSNNNNNNNKKLSYRRETAHQLPT